MERRYYALETATGKWIALYVEESEAPDGAIELGERTGWAWNGPKNHPIKA